MTVEQNRRKYLGFTPRNRKFLGRIHEVQNPLFTVNHELQRKNLGRKIVNPLYAATRNRNHTFHREFGQRNLFHPRNH
jgi:hypothetical protein